MTGTARIALVTGAAGVIGSAVTRALLDDGAVVVAADLAARSAGPVPGELADRWLPRALDVADEASWSRLADEVEERFGRLDVLVNNAGVMRPGPLQTTTVEDYARMVAVNQTGVFLGMRACLPLMIRAGGGHIINMASFASLEGIPGLSAYCASKHAVLGLTRSAAMEVVGLGVRVNAICPGAVATPLMQGIDRSALGYAPEELLAQVPIQRPAAPEEIAGAVLFLAGEASSSMTGSTLVVDGGWSAGRVASGRQREYCSP
ncbi:SDR family NAD(P)-dependent oxidoreductase [Streptomyces alanosinicus]|uniref:Dehydrogenase n=1 Tax=Streptomyces alanosinicus TaxID=68171 RepID=A0A918YD20_9ACTN|nr:SDR family oxidoreductase [Streptomyces alanosinicus]GHD98969.1 dehydrogenase [Streptomyces alanosinicus]